MKKTVLLSAFIAVSAISLSKETVVAPIKVVEPTAPVVKPANINLEAIGKMLTVAKASTNKPTDTAPALKSMPGFSLGAPAGLTGSFGSVFAVVAGTASGTVVEPIVNHCAMLYKYRLRET